MMMNITIFMSLENDTLTNSVIFSFRHPEYYKLIEDPIDMNTIERNILTGKYKSVEAFDNDFLKLFKNVEVCLHATLNTKYILCTFLIL